MGTVTKILENQGTARDRVYVYIDEKFCVSIRQRTWIAMNLNIGSQIACEDLKILEGNFWKKIYGIKSWEREKVRINRVIKWFNNYIPEVKVLPRGLGADSNDYFENIHSKEKGAPDLSVRRASSDTEIIALEVSGTDKMQGEDFWIRRDKIDYIQNHIEKDIWIVLHYQLPTESFTWIKIIPDKLYTTKIINIKGADEYYVVLSKNDKEIKTSAIFKDYISSLLNPDEIDICQFRATVIN